MLAKWIRCVESKKNQHSRLRLLNKSTELLQRGKTPPPHTHTLNEYPKHDTKQSYGDGPILGLWGIRNTSSLPLLPALLWFGVAVPVSVPSMAQIELFIELPWPENTVITYAWHTETLDSCFGRIRSYQQCIPSSPPLEIEPANTDCRAETLQMSQQPISHTSNVKLTSHGKCAANLNVSCKLQRTRSPPEPRLPKRIRNTHPNKVETALQCFRMVYISARRIFWSW